MDPVMPAVVRSAASVRGVVQGVGFRYSTIRAAERLGLEGWVSNMPDGSVEVVAEGDRSRLESLIAWLRTGPPAARVTSVGVSWEPATGEFVGFVVR